MHVTIPKPLRTFLKWEAGVDLMVTVTDDQRLEIETLEQCIERNRDEVRRQLLANPELLRR